MKSAFTFLKDVCPEALQSCRYYGNNNFLGKTVPGYDSDQIICTYQAAEALEKVSQILHHKGYKLVVYDAYRPQRSVDVFIQWAEDSADDSDLKNQYYPRIDKKDLFALGYLAKKSGHSRGSTVDLTIIPANDDLYSVNLVYREFKNASQTDGLLNRICDIPNFNLLDQGPVTTCYDSIYLPYLDDGTCDMGTSFDLLDEASWHSCPFITPPQRSNRRLLRQVMEECGFKAYEKEWWHYTLINEPFPDTYFDFTANEIK
jgi:D-alanyl-D-alanine dipeptidase